MISNLHKIWNHLHDHPGQTSLEIFQALPDIPHNSLYASLSQLSSRKILRSEGPEKPYKWYCAEESYPQVLIDMEELRERRRADREAGIAPPRKSHHKKKVEPENQTASSGQEQANKNVKRINWDQEEIESLVSYWAAEHIRIGIALTEIGLRKITEREGHGFRPRKLQQHQSRKFVTDYGTLAHKEVERLRAMSTTPTTDSEPAPKPVHGQFAGVGEMIEQALVNIVTKIVFEQVALVEARIMEAFKGIPNYNRPLILKPQESQVEEPKNKKYQVIIVNALPAQFQSVERAFPELDLRLSQDRLPAEEDPDLVISLTKFMSHPLDRALKKKYGNRYTPVNGAADSVKLAIAHRLQLPLAGKNGHNGASLAS